MARAGINAASAEQRQVWHATPAKAGAPCPACPPAHAKAAAAHPRWKCASHRLERRGHHGDIRNDVLHTHVLPFIYVAVFDHHFQPRAAATAALLPASGLVVAHARGKACKINHRAAATAAAHRPAHKLVPAQARCHQPCAIHHRTLQCLERHCRESASRQIWRKRCFVFAQSSRAQPAQHSVSSDVGPRRHLAVVACIGAAASGSPQCGNAVCTPARIVAIYGRSSQGDDG
mmetsp:Transcript_24699/g.79768  ORF Transcript_24699/g.79768 Transcript_24699/m.79768 type:complete len:232 (-) Transcript_24699:122-817(-)